MIRRLMRSPATAGSDPAGEAPVADREPSPTPSPDAFERAQVKTQREAFEGVVAALRDLAAIRGHRLNPRVQDGMYEVTMRCSRCERWITVELPTGAGDRSQNTHQGGVTGGALTACKGKPWGKVAAQAMGTGDTTHGIIR
jgi:hypothetical protein